ncbi:uncharacterized protein LOC110462892 [Mizuhopecten yessoensis]|uniref:Acyl-ACP thioesterase n=1 Tax=Mizuhopecten yessoensis TaxID=6573 RepID=A0A210PXC5_MIZYE|nr:uncharacterized protein LOC110462892 [Mizuhopecten yessoensis]OWF41119.1 hypothetical protein KP79_PYT04784 [Mizuhopecten yessoensis]
MLPTVLRRSTNLAKQMLYNRGNLAHKRLYSTDNTEKHGNNRKEALLALNYRLEHVDSTVPEAVVKHPGLSYNDYDSNGQPKIWMIMKMLESIRFFAHHYPLDDTGRTFRDYEQMTKDCLMFLVTSEFILSKGIYRPSPITPWMKTSVKGGYVGKTSLNASTEMRCENSGQIMASNINQIVCVDKRSRRPMPLPLWWREKYSESGKKHKALNINKFEIPDETCIYHTNVAWSDTDLNLHANWTAYARFAVDAAHHCYQNGALQNFEDNFANGIHKVQIYFYGESVQGDKLAVHVWEDKTDHRLLMVDIFNKGQSICQIKLFFH